MKLMFLIALFILLGIINDCVRADSHSEHLTHFNIQQSMGQVGFSARGELGFVSHTQDTLAAASVRLQIFQGAAVSTYECASFSYNLKSGFALCDNREVHKTSLSIDSTFTVRKYAP